MQASTHSQRSAPHCFLRSSGLSSERADFAASRRSWSAPSRISCVTGSGIAELLRGAPRLAGPLGVRVPAAQRRGDDVVPRAARALRLAARRHELALVGDALEVAEEARDIGHVV